MPSLFSRLAQLFPGFRPAPAPPPTPAERAETVKAVKQQLDDTPRRGRPVAGERVPGNYGGGVAGKVWFLPYLDSATKDSPEIRAALKVMNRDPYVKAAWEPQVLSVAAEDWQVQPAEEGHPDAEEQAAFVTTIFDDYLAGGVPQLVRSIAAPWGCAGHSLAEPVFEPAARGRLQGQIVCTAVKAKDTDPAYLRLEGDRYNTVRWVKSMRAADAESWPIADFVFSRYMTVFDEPLGQAAYRSSYGAYWMRDTVRKLRAIHCEKKNGGMLVGTFANEDDKPILMEALERAKSTTWMAIPEGCRVEAMAISTASETDYKSFDESLREEIVTGIAFATLQILMGTVPDARGDSKVQKAIFDLAPWLVMYLTMDAVNTQLIPRLIDYNFAFPAGGGYPKLTFGAVSNAELLEILQLVQGAQGIGLTPSKKYYAKTLSIQQADPNDPEDALAPGGAMGGFGGFGGGTAGTAGTGGGGFPPPGGGGGLPGGGLTPFAEPRVGVFGSTGWKKVMHKHTTHTQYPYYARNVETGEKRYGKAADEVLAAEPERKRTTREEVTHTARQVNRAAGQVARGPIAGARLGAAAARGVGRGIDRLGKALESAAGKGSWLAALPKSGAEFGRVLTRVAQRALDRADAVDRAAAAGGLTRATKEAAKRWWEVEVGRRFWQNKRKYGLVPAAAFVALKVAARTTGFLVQQSTRLPGLGPVIAAGKEFLGSFVNALAQWGTGAAMNLAWRSPVGRALGTMRTYRNPQAAGRLAAALEAGKAVAVPDAARPRVTAILKQSKEGRAAIARGFAERAWASDPLELVIDLRRQLDEAAAAEGQGPVPYTDEELADAVAELMEFAAERLEALGESFAETDQDFEAFAWEDWKQVEGGKWRSPGGRVLSNETYQRLKGAKPGGKPTAGPTPAVGVSVSDVYERAGSSAKRSEINAALRAIGGMTHQQAAAELEAAGQSPGKDPRRQLASLIADRRDSFSRRSAGTGGGKANQEELRARFRALEDESAITIGAALAGPPPAQPTPAAAPPAPDPDAPKSSAGMAPPAAPPGVRELDPQEIAVDPARFQFKLRTDAKTGVGAELQSVEHYNPELAGVLAVWQDPADGKTYVVNGHHRLDLATRAGAPSVLVRHLKAATAEEARAKGALINIAEGRGTAVDAAKFLRDTGTTVDDLKKVGVSVSGAVARDAVTLSKLDGGLFHRVTLGVIDVPKALAIAAHLPDHEDQVTLWGYIDRQEKRTGKPMAPSVVAELAKESAATPKAAVAGSADSLFGTDAEEESVFLQRAELKSFIRTSLTTRARDYRLLSSKRRAEAVKGAGNVIDPTANRAAADESGDLLAQFDRSANRAGAVSDAINAAAAEYANATREADRDRIRRRALAAVEAALSPRLI